MLEYIVFPSDYFSPDKIDAELAEEYGAALETGLYKTVLFDYDKWFNENKLRLTHVPDNPVTAVYRGWMMKPEQYSDFYNRLKGNNICLLTSPEEYERFHIFPNIYPDIKQSTAKTLIYPDGAQPDLNEIKKEFSRFMVKDFVKSVKGTSFPKFFTSDITEEEFRRHMETFYKFRGGLYTGGICVKEYLDLKTYDGKTNEYRIFIANGHIASVSKNSLQPRYTADFPAELTEKYKNLGSPFYTLDFAELADGTWKIIEAGDGQVSGLSPEQDNYNFFRTLYYIFNFNE